MQLFFSRVREFPKLLSMLGSILLAYLLFRAGAFDLVATYLHGHGYISAFIGGMLFTVGFTTPFGIAILIAVSSEVNPLLGALVAGTAASIMDFTIFEFAKISLHEEIEHLKGTRTLMWLKSHLFHKSLSERIRLYMLWCIAGIIIASPLPDEFGVTMLSGVSNLEAKRFAVLCFIFNTLGVFLLLSVASAL